MGNILSGGTIIKGALHEAISPKRKVKTLALRNLRKVSQKGVLFINF